MRDRLQPVRTADRTAAASRSKCGWRFPLRRAALFLTISLLLSQAARAAIIAYDPFNQGVGDINGTASSGGDPKAEWQGDGKWTKVGGTVTIEPNSLSYGSLITQGNHVKVTNESRSYAVRSFNRTYGSGTVPENVWLSFLMQGTTANKDEGLYLDLNSKGKLFIGHIHASWANGNAYGIQDLTLVTAPRAFVPDVKVDTNTHLFVVHLDNTISGSSTIRLYLPAASYLGSASPPTTPSASFTTSNAISFDQIRIETEGSTVLFDEFRMGTSWADVTPVNGPSPLPTVPEPSSWVLSCLLLSLGIVFGWRRRRQSTQAA